MACPPPCWTYTCCSRAVFQMLLLLDLLNSLLPTPTHVPYVLHVLRSLSLSNNSPLCPLPLKRLFSSHTDGVVLLSPLQVLRFFRGSSRLQRVHNSSCPTSVMISRGSVLCDVSLIWVIRVKCLGGDDASTVLSFWLLPSTCVAVTFTHA